MKPLDRSTSDGRTMLLVMEASIMRPWPRRSSVRKARPLSIASRGASGERACSHTRIPPSEQHDQVRAKTQNIAEDVADVDNRDALRAQPTDNLEQPLRLARRQRRRRFVKDYKAGLPGQRFCDLDQLTFALG